MPGKLFGIGVGPGDPELLTIKAVRVLKSAGHIFTPVSRKGSESVALAVAEQFIPGQTPVTRLLFPMTKDEKLLHQQWMENYRAIEEVLRHGIDSAFLTLGDPSTYSTYGTMARLFKENAPDLELETVPGVTSFADAAARMGVPLAEGNEIISIVSARDSLERLEEVIETADTVIFLKTYRTGDSLIRILKQKGLIRYCTYIKRSGMKGEEMMQGIEQLPQTPDYLSLLVLKKPNR